MSGCWTSFRGLADGRRKQGDNPVGLSHAGNQRDAGEEGLRSRREQPAPLRPRLDVHLGDKLTDAMKAARAMQRGGVGWYPQSNFMHIDSGPVRNWDLDHKERGTLLVAARRCISTNGATSCSPRARTWSTSRPRLCCAAKARSACATDWRDCASSPVPNTSPAADLCQRPWQRCHSRRRKAALQERETWRALGGGDKGKGTPNVR